MELAEKERETAMLLAAAKSKLPELTALLAEASVHWNYEDSAYRFYHQSFKIYCVQSLTEKIVAELRELAPRLPPNTDFLRIIEDGTGKEFTPTHNQDWHRHTRPIIEAFWHARHMLLMACKYAKELDEPPMPMPSGWATLLYLYNLR